MEKEIDHTKMGDDYCPVCNYKIDCASVAAGEHQVPNPHDISVCLNCGEPLEFADDMALIILTEKTRKELTVRQLTIMRSATNYIKKRGLIKK